HRRNSPSADIPYHQQPSHTISSHPIPSAAIPYHQQTSHTISSHPIPSADIPYHQQPSHTISSHPIPSAAIPYHQQPSHTISSHSIPSAAIPYHQQPSHTISRHPIPSAAIPYHQQTSHTISSHPIPSAAIPYHQQPSHTISSHPIPSAAIPYHQQPSHTISSHPVPSAAIPYHQQPSHTISSHPIPSAAIPYHQQPSHTISSHPIPSAAIPYHQQPSHTISSHPVPSAAIPYHQQPSHTISSHPIPSAAIPYHLLPSHTISRHPVPSAAIPFSEVFLILPVPFHSGYEHIHVARGDWFAPLHEMGMHGRLHVIVSNPPYIPCRLLPSLLTELSSPHFLSMPQEHIHVARGDWFAPLHEMAMHGRLHGIVSNPPYIPCHLLPSLQPEVLQNVGLHISLHDLQSVQGGFILPPSIQTPLCFPTEICNCPPSGAAKRGSLHSSGLHDLQLVLRNVGLCISLYDLQSVEGGFIFPSDPGPHFTVRFRLVVFSPFAGEVLVGRLVKCDATGLFVSLDFFSDIHIPHYNLQEPSVFDEQEKLWVWKFNDNDMFLDMDELIRFKVVSVKYPPLPVEQDKGATAFATMEIVGDINGDGLGLLSWWS
ncbi:unnamed protein product, partial [Closterium sp. Naga37s-1]